MLPVGDENFAQIRQDLTAPNIISALRQDPELRSKLTAVEQSAFDTIANEIGTPDEYPSISEYILRALPYVKMTYASSETTEPVMPSEQIIQLLMRERFL